MFEFENLNVRAIDGLCCRNRRKRDEYYNTCDNGQSVLHLTNFSHR